VSRIYDFSEATRNTFELHEIRGQIDHKRDELRDKINRELISSGAAATSSHDSRGAGVDHPNVDKPNGNSSSKPNSGSIAVKPGGFH
jgi:hypothetical protein